MKTYKFLKITDNNDYRNFYIDFTSMNDHRIRLSILWGRYMNYLEGVGSYHPVFKVLNTDWSAYCVYRDSYDNIDDVRQQQQTLVNFYEDTLSNYTPKEFSNIISFS